MDISIKTKKISGEIDAISSKSHGHRVLICAALSDKPTNVIIKNLSVDIDTTINCLKSLGAKILINGENIEVNPIKKISEKPILNCMESGSTFRFLVPVAAAIYKEVEFVGQGRLPERPMSELIDTMESQGANFSNKKLPFTIKNSLIRGMFELQGDVSSQYISGLLFAAPLLNEDVNIKLTTKLESKAYVEMTIDVMEQFGIKVERLENGFLVRKGQKYISKEVVTIEGDWSNAAFFLSAGAIGKEVKVNKLNVNSIQGDKEIINILKSFGANVEVGNDYVKVGPGELKGIDIDISEVPDSLPILSIVASAAKGKTNFTNCKRLRLKESDRLITSRQMVRNLGGEVIERKDSLTIKGSGYLKNGTIYSFNDHRIAMASAIASIIAKGDIIIKDAEAVNKSYPKFYEDFKKLGGEVSDI